MKAEELMIGDLLRISEEGICIKKDTIVEVRAINEDDFLKYDGRELKGAAHCRPIGDPRLFDGGVWCAYLEPIPLIPEILEKNGFMNIEGDFYLRFGDYKIVFDKHNDPFVMKEFDSNGFLYEVPILEVTYIHELQHFLRLCGIDKEIVL